MKKKLFSQVKKHVLGLLLILSTVTGCGHVTGNVESGDFCIRAGYITSLCPTEKEKAERDFDPCEWDDPHTCRQIDRHNADVETCY